MTNKEQKKIQRYQKAIVPEKHIFKLVSESLKLFVDKQGNFYVLEEIEGQHFLRELTTHEPYLRSFRGIL